jgi:hypothetical protein
MKVSMLLSVIILLIFSSCSNKTNIQDGSSEIIMPEPPVIIYRTSGNFTENVAVSLTDEGDSLKSFPAPADIRARLKAVSPVKLINGFFLDRQGISENTAFLNYTFEEFSKLKTTPKASELLDEIKERDAITEIYRCPFKRSDPELVNKLNQLINDERFEQCQALHRN